MKGCEDRLEGGMSTRFGIKRINAGYIQTQDTINIENTDREKIHRPGESGKKIMLVQSKMQHSA